MFTLAHTAAIVYRHADTLHVEHSDSTVTITKPQFYIVIKVRPDIVYISVYEGEDEELTNTYTAMDYDELETLVCECL
ncbi:hypothetical protein [Moraxella atlantae]|uniref:Uncharacterized protein n=1 Tax=Faucicola atlantae TaxID=34059 RepID=A0A378Q2W4_9GAMM|nr:hypothetical protein [Moraxella atlantae]STY95042.1 Uncharacterised protein [Moraxella atlantae]